jgi:hypothetical protein
MATLAEQLAQAERQVAEAEQRVAAAEAKLAELKRAALSNNFLPLDNPANLEAFKVARAKVTEFQNGELAELELAKGAAYRTERDLQQAVQQEQQKSAAETAERAQVISAPFCARVLNRG